MNMKIPLVLVIVMTLATAAGAQSSRAASGDTAFATKAAQANLAEIELGKLAQQKAMRDEVKQFAQRMVADHGKKLDELKGLAASKNITLPSANTPVANYVGAVRVGNLLFISGHGPIRDGKATARGKVGKDLSTEQGYQVARDVGTNLARQARLRAHHLLHQAHLVGLLEAWLERD